MKGARLLLLVATTCSLAPPASAERLVISLSSPQVAISSNFTGTAITLFGVVERDAQSAARSGGYDVVVTMRGPPEATTVRLKQPLGPIWLNRDQEKFVDVPSLLAVYASRPIADMIDPAFRQRSRIGLAAAIGTPLRDVEMQDPFLAALIRLKRRAGLYVENGSGATFITDTFFRARVPLPANAPLGEYRIEAALLASGAVLSREEAQFTVMKAGVEARISEAARDQPLLYGLGTAALALAFGWLASVIFRRD